VCVATHIYGVLEQLGRARLLEKARRVASSRIVLLDSGRPASVPAEQWQERSSGLDEHVYNVHRRHFEAQEIADEIDGLVLFEGQFDVVIAA
jgi:hypothetical protein